MRNSIKKRFGLTLTLVVFIFFVLFAAMLLAGLLIVVLHSAGVLNYLNEIRPDNAGGGAPLRAIFMMMAFSTLLGITIAGFFSKRALSPIKQFIEATRNVAGGDFSVRLDIHGIYELEQLSQSFNKMAHELSTIETLRIDFINIFSHEFKTPIVSVRGFAKLLKEGNLSAQEQQEYLDIIISESERLAALSANVLNLTRYENLEIVSDKTAFRLDEQVRRAVIQMEPKWSKKDVTVIVEADEVVFTGSLDLTRQILLNLIDNAVKFSNVGGTVSILLSQHNNGACLTIKDNGIGMDAQTLARVFDTFYQGDPSRAGVGNGLGLAIVKRIVDLCGGKIDVQSELGVGSGFSVWLPHTSGY